MRLYILRHGKAGEGYPDEVRELTERGRSDVHEVVTRRREEMDDVGYIESSPLVRAVQTAEIVKSSLGFDCSLGINDALVPWGDPKQLLDSLEKSFVDISSKHQNAVLLASHQPLVSRLVEYLSEESINMSTSCLVSIEAEFLERGCGKLNWVEMP